MKYVHALLLLIALLAPTRLWAVEPDEMLSDPTLEARARALSKELRCMVCQNESIDDSGAPLAHDLRVLVRDRIKAGDSDAQVLDFLVARYGEFVLLKPRLSWHTAALWGLPPTVLLVGAAVILLDLRRRRSGQVAGEQENLTSAEEARLAELLRDSSAT
ncbi:MAG: cytochrome c-type biogenesis protein [Xanthobacteraceae bacterium]